jgi:hypothetical protein
MQIAADTRPVSPRARLAIRLALIPILINLASVVLQGVLDVAYRSATPNLQVLLSVVAWTFVVIRALAVIVLSALAIVFAVRAWPETAPAAEFQGRGRLIWVFVLTGVYLVGLFVTFVYLVQL